MAGCKLCTAAKGKVYRLDLALSPYLHVHEGPLIHHAGLDGSVADGGSLPVHALERRLDVIRRKHHFVVLDLDMGRNIGKGPSIVIHRPDHVGQAVCPPLVLGDRKSVV